MPTSRTVSILPALTLGAGDLAVVSAGQRTPNFLELSLPLLWLSPVCLQEVLTVALQVQCQLARSLNANMLGCTSVCSTAFNTASKQPCTAFCGTWSCTLLLHADAIAESLSRPLAHAQALKLTVNVLYGF